MKILHLNLFDDPADGAGAERVMWALSHALTQAGHANAIAGTKARGPVEKFSRDGITVWRAALRNLYWPSLRETQPVLYRRFWHLLDIYNFFMRQSLGSILKSERPDIVIIHNLTGWSISAVSEIRARKIPIIQVLHDQYNICSNSMMYKGGKNCEVQCGSCRVMRAPHRRITDQVDAVIGVSRFILDRHVAYGAYTKVPIRRVIHNAAAAEALGVPPPGAPRPRSVKEIPSPGIRFGFIGSLIPNKGIEYLLEVFAAWDRPDAELWIAGAGKPDYVAMLKSRFEGGRVRFLGHTKPSDFFKAIDVLVVPSLWQENFPGVVVESFAFGVPVIGSKRGGIPDMISDGKAGIIFDPDQAGALTAAMQYLADDPAALDAMGEQAFTERHKFLDVANWQQQYVKLIDDVLAGR